MQTQNPALAAASRRSTTQTRTTELVATLADDIIHGRLAPGVRLDEQDLAARFGVSRTPVREALGHLVATGLAEHRPRRGVIVTVISPERLRDMFLVMAELEASAARLAASAMTALERRELALFHQGTQVAVRHGRITDYEQLNDQFHSLLYVGCHNSYLFDLLNATRARLAPFRHAQFNLLGRLAASWREHDVVVQAILRGDSDAAAQGMRSHLSTVSGAAADYVAIQVPVPPAPRNPAR
ncbi:MAG: GntR family transcriptional regulator [Azospirillaceae bacterium]|nr:GntR family transcriptional regulator [Azospirillaceae bacterium]